MAIDSAQRKWLKALGALVGEAPAAADDEEEDEQADEPGSDEGDAGGLLAPTRKSRKSRLAEGLDGAPGAEAPVAAGFVPELLSWSGAVLKLLSKIGPGQCTCAIQVHNKTGLRISRSVIRPESQILKLPPDAIEPNDHGEFVMGGPPPLIPGSNLPIAGCIGQMDWIVTGDVNFTIKWDNPIAGDITSDASLTDIGPASAFSVDHINTNKHQAEFKFTIFGGPKPPPPNPGPNPNPGPGPAPAGEIASSCLVHVKNTTQQKLTLKDAGHDRGDFMVKPKTEIEAGGADDDIVSIETPRGKENGCKGFLEYTIGNPPAGVWRLEWDNPEGQKNTAKGTIDPASKTLSSLALIGQGDENVGADFTLRDAGGTPPTPVPPTPVPPNPVPPNPVPPNPVPPDPTPPNPTPPNPTPPGQLPKTRQPTLRVNDKSADGWVEYLQERLNELIKAGLKVDGVFGPKTLAKVHEFQVSRHLQNDGTVGNQTWAALRDATPEDPGTDGRKPHSFVQKGPQARWEDEKERALYIADLDMMLILLVSVGTEPIDSFSVDVTVTAPGMPASTKSVVIGPPNKKSTTGSGDLHNVLIHDFRKVFPSKDPAAKVTDYAIQAVLPQALSGEGWTGPIVVG